jgi:hypothetical protein
MFLGCCTAEISASKSSIANDNIDAKTSKMGADKIIYTQCDEAPMLAT